MSKNNQISSHAGILFGQDSSLVGFTAAHVVSETGTSIKKSTTKSETTEITSYMSLFFQSPQLSPEGLSTLKQILEFCQSLGFMQFNDYKMVSVDDAITKFKQSDAVFMWMNPTIHKLQPMLLTLLPGLLKTLASNIDMPLPLKLFQLQDIAVKDERMAGGARNERRLAAIYYAKEDAFVNIQGIFDQIMRTLKVNPAKGYYIEADENPTYFPGRCAKIIGPKGVVLGHIGALHPDVITSFGLTLPCGAVEFNVEPFL